MDQAVFFKVDEKARELTVVAVHVHDCTGPVRLVEDMKEGHVVVTDLSELHRMLGIEVKRNCAAGIIPLSQRAYINIILRRCNLDGLKPFSTHMDTQLRLSTDQAPESTAMSAVMRDCEAVDVPDCAAGATLPDIAFAVATVARFAANPGLAYWEAVERIYKYLAGTRELWLSCGETERAVVGYTDADGSMTEDRSAISGYAFLIDRGVLSLSSKWQSLSTIESEYVAVIRTDGPKEALWLHSLLPPDNQAAIAPPRDHRYHACTKHTDVRYHRICWVAELVRCGWCVPYKGHGRRRVDQSVAVSKGEAFSFTADLGLGAK